MHFATGLTIDEDLPMVWESPDTLRIGLEQPLARLFEITTAEQKFVSALRRGIPADRINETARRSGLTPAARESLLKRVSPALSSSPPVREQPSEPSRVCIVTGKDWAAPGWAELLAVALRTTGVSCFVATHPDSLDASISRAVAPPPNGAKVVDLLILPERYAAPQAEVAPWLALGIPVLSVRLRDRAVLVGPLLGLPGSPCLDCCNRAETERDAGWPLVTAQLWGTRPPSETPSVALAIAAHAAIFVALEGTAGHQIRFPVRHGLPELGAEPLVVPQRANCACVGLGAALISVASADTLPHWDSTND